MKKIFLVILLWSSCCFANTLFDTSEILRESKQLILVTVQHENESQGILQRFQRHSANEAWQAVGNRMEVTIGSNGMGVPADLSHDIKMPIKKEGDRRTPIGIFKLGPAFGFERSSSDQMIKKLDYVSINETTVCVDDQKSRYYNQILDSRQITHPDWDSKEEMREEPLYQYGIVIQYNDKNIPGAGSCIFMHLRSESSKEGTQGCIVLDSADLKHLLLWLDKTRHPTIVLFPESEKGRLSLEVPSLNK